MGNAADALIAAARTLAPVGETARLDAEYLLAHTLGLERGTMLLRLRDLDAPEEFVALVQRRQGHEPVAYILGYQHFWDLKLSVTPDVLIPRSDSETLIEAARDYFGAEQPSAVLDLGTGSGALLLAALSLFPHAKGIGVDASPAALAVAQQNAADMAFGARAEFRLASWRDAGWSDALGQYDLILCNPPYVETAAMLARQVSEHEPHAALFAGIDGLDDYRILIPQIPALLAPGGLALFELGMGQDAAVSNLAGSVGLQCTLHRDLAGICRALAMTA
jgi:release factor glutamine methyltransferase